MVPPLATAHTFCTSRDVTAKTATREKQILARVVGIRKQNDGKSHIFSEIIKLQIGNKIPHIVLYFNTFLN